MKTSMGMRVHYCPCGQGLHLLGLGQNCTSLYSNISAFCLLHYYTKFQVKNYITLPIILMQNQPINESLFTWKPELQKQ